MHKKKLTEQSIYYGDISMPKNFEIDRKELSHHILHSTFDDEDMLYSRTTEKLSNYIKEHLLVKYHLNLVYQKTWGDIYKPQQVSPPLLNVDPVNLRNSPDYTLLYGVKAVDCNVRIHYDDNRRKGRSWDMELIDNMFIMFPSNCMYFISNKQKEPLNFIQTITYTYV